MRVHNGEYLGFGALGLCLLEEGVYTVLYSGLSAYVASCLGSRVHGALNVGFGLRFGVVGFRVLFFGLRVAGNKPKG